MTPYVYVAVRGDLSAEQVAVQAAHATHESGACFGAPEGTHLVLVKVPNEEALMRLSEHLSNARVEHIVFYEPDPPGPGNTALCTAPVSGSLRRHFKHLELYT